MKHVIPKRYNNIIYKLSLKSKKIIKVTLSSITKIRLIVYIKDLKKAFSVNYIHIKKETTIVDIITTTYPIKSDIIFIINLNTS
jgi:hypothetical protein